jgi:hypothetical protein
MRFINYIIILATCTILPGSCGKIEQLPAVPRIEFRNFTVFDSIDILGNKAKGAKLLFYFEDGDGDLGIERSSDGISDSLNLLLTLYRKENGIMTPDTVSKSPYSRHGYRIPYMERLGQNKILRGTIKVSFLYAVYSAGDTIIYDFKIRDRAGNESNVASTCEIVLSRNGDCSTPSR